MIKRCPNQDSSAAMRSKDIANITARGVMRKRNSEDSSFKSWKMGRRAKVLKDDTSSSSN